MPKIVYIKAPPSSSSSSSSTPPSGPPPATNNSHPRSPILNITSNTTAPIATTTEINSNMVTPNVWAKVAKAGNGSTNGVQLAVDHAKPGVVVNGGDAPKSSETQVGEDWAPFQSKRSKSVNGTTVKNQSNGPSSNGHINSAIVKNDTNGISDKSQINGTSVNGNSKASSANGHSNGAASPPDPSSAKKDQYIEALKVKLRIKEQYIEELVAQVDERDRRVEQLEADVTSQRQLIAELEERYEILLNNQAGDVQSAEDIVDSSQDDSDPKAESDVDMAPQVEPEEPTAMQIEAPSSPEHETTPSPKSSSGQQKSTDASGSPETQKSSSPSDSIELLEPPNARDVSSSPGLPKSPPAVQSAVKPAPKLTFPVQLQKIGKVASANSTKVSTSKTTTSPGSWSAGKTYKDLRDMPLSERAELFQGPTITAIIGNQHVRGIPKHMFMAASDKVRKYFIENPQETYIPFQAGTVAVPVMNILKEYLTNMGSSPKVFSIKLRGNIVQDLAIRRDCIFLGMEKYVAHFTKNFCDKVRGGYPGLENIAIIERNTTDDDSLWTCLCNNLSSMRMRNAVPDIAKFDEFLTNHPRLARSMADIEARIRKQANGKTNGHSPPGKGPMPNHKKNVSNGTNGNVGTPSRSGGNGTHHGQNGKTRVAGTSPGPVNKGSPRK